jgi:hypothetical protein
VRVLRPGVVHVRGTSRRRQRRVPAPWEAEVRRLAASFHARQLNPLTQYLRPGSEIDVPREEEEENRFSPPSAGEPWGEQRGGAEATPHAEEGVGSVADGGGVDDDPGGRDADVAKHSGDSLELPPPPAAREVLDWADDGEEEEWRGAGAAERPHDAGSASVQVAAAASDLGPRERGGEGGGEEGVDRATLQVAAELGDVDAQRLLRLEESPFVVVRGRGGKKRGDGKGVREGDAGRGARQDRRKEARRKGGESVTAVPLRVGPADAAKRSQVRYGTEDATHVEQKVHEDEGERKEVEGGGGGEGRFHTPDKVEEQLAGGEVSLVMTKKPLHLNPNAPAFAPTQSPPPSPNRSPPFFMPPGPPALYPHSIPVLYGWRGAPMPPPWLRP